ncbi:MAG TPA: hypothetical protein DEB31_11810 [Clostridiales bacterium]|nr:hypothetical protein [Clostridiales bacterium]
MSCYFIVGIRVDNRTSNALKLQEALTGHGCNIKARLGLHEADGNSCSTDGLIVLHLCGELAQVEEMMESLNALPGITAQFMDLN